MPGYTEQEMLNLPQTIMAHDVARILRISEPKVRSMAQEQKLPAVKICNGWRFNRDEILDLVGLSIEKLSETVSRRKIAEEIANKKWEDAVRSSLIDEPMIGAQAPRAASNQSTSPAMQAFLKMINDMVVSNEYGRADSSPLSSR